MASRNLDLFPARIAFVDTATGRLTPSAVRALQDMFSRSGGYTGLPEAFPVGAIFTSVSGTNPASVLGYGTWAAFGAGRTLVGVDSGDADFDAAMETGGAKAVTLTHTGAAVADHTSHTHTYTEVPNHTHPVGSATQGGAGAAGYFAGGTASATSGNPTGGVTTATTNGPDAPLSHTVTQPDAHAVSVVQPYITVYFWRRTA